MGKANQWLKMPIGKRLRLLHSAAATQLEMQRTRIPHSYVPWKERTYNKTDAGNKPMIFFPENRLHQRYLMLHPEARHEAVELSSFNPPMPRRYAWKVLNLIQQGWSPRRARAEVDKQLQAYQASRIAERQRSADGQPTSSVIAAVQREEEHRLQEAIKQRRQEKVDEDASVDKRITVRVAGLKVTL